MGIIELFLIAVGLSMDAFAVSVCKGLATERPKPKHYLAVGLWFGGFQALMPTIGFFLGSAFERFITSFDHWVAFALLALIGANMIREGCSKDEGDEIGKAADGKSEFAFLTMLLLAVATSIDALAVGISFGVVGNVNIAIAAALIGVTTCLLSALGLRIGNVFGTKYKNRAEIAGGVILILIGIKVLLEHLGVLPF